MPREFAYMREHGFFVFGNVRHGIVTGHFALVGPHRCSACALEFLRLSHSLMAWEMAFTISINRKVLRHIITHPSLRRYGAERTFIAWFGMWLCHYSSSNPPLDLWSSILSSSCQFCCAFLRPPA